MRPTPMRTTGLPCTLAEQAFEEITETRATGTAGSAVVFAGVTVLIALIGLGFAGMLLGSVSTAVVQAAKVPVIVARRRATSD